MRKLLIVSPHWSPVNAPDMQRVRLYLPYFRDYGWEPTILAVDPSRIEGATLDPEMGNTFPADIRTIRTKGIPPAWTRRFGFGNIWWRCGRSFRQAGERLLEHEHFDLAFFSTTQFPFFQLAPRWKRKFGLNYVLDYQDPWLNSYYADHQVSPPGGRLKYWLSTRTARLHEPSVLNTCAGVVAVSQNYLSVIRRSLPSFANDRFVTIPFGASENDLLIARRHNPSIKPFLPDDGNIHFVYTGRCGPDMQTALRILFSAFAQFSESNHVAALKCRFHFLGTDYSPPPRGREWVMPLAREYRLDNLVSEHPARIPYFDALHFLTRAHVLMAIGSDDPTYAASKLYPYILTKNRLIGIFHQNGPSLALANRTNAGFRYAFSQPADIPRVAAQLASDGVFQPAEKTWPTINDTDIGLISARFLAKDLCAFFERVGT